MYAKGWKEERLSENLDHFFESLTRILSALVFLFMIGLEFQLLYHKMELLVIYKTVAYVLLHGMEKGFRNYWYFVLHTVNWSIWQLCNKILYEGYL